VRALWVVVGAPAIQTADMTGDAKASAFVTCADGFIGRELVRVLVAGGHRVFGLTSSVDAAQRVRRAGAEAVMGDLLEAGPWQDEAAAECVFHVPPHSLSGHRLTVGRAAVLARERVVMDAHLLDAVSSGETRRIVYVGDHSCYGATGPRPITEDQPLHPSALGRCFAPALERLEGYAVAGLPIVTAFPGWVFGNASWFHDRVIRPVMSGRRVLQFGASGPWVSPIHARDCARALVHLATHGEIGSRYFLVNRDPIRLNEFAAAFARLANRALRVWRVPAAATRLVAGPVLDDYLRSDAVFSNIRLRGTGFQFFYPTLEQGLQQVIDSLHE
jgi:nucleoside-diphosphate-sugar epimerase